jgi:hypothetical protein
MPSENMSLNFSKGWLVIDLVYVVGNLLSIKNPICLKTDKN